MGQSRAFAKAAITEKVLSYIPIHAGTVQFIYSSSKLGNYSRCRSASATAFPSNIAVYEGLQYAVHTIDQGLHLSFHFKNTTTDNVLYIYIYIPYTNNVYPKLLIIYNLHILSIHYPMGFLQCFVFQPINWVEKHDIIKPTQGVVDGSLV